jgi:dethiobiotin synthetase
MTLLVVGSDTGVGKTVFSGFFGRYLKSRGVSIHLTKPFCSGGRGDIEFLAKCGEVSEAEVNFWYDDEPVSPAAWELRSDEKVDFDGIFFSLKERADNDFYDVLLVEGVGGLLAPLSKSNTVASFAKMLGAQLIVVAHNRVGVVNHILLTIDSALSRGISVACVVLMEQQKQDASAVDNAELIGIHLPEMANFKGVFEFPWLGEEADNPEMVAINSKKAEKVLENIFYEVINPFFLNDSSN